MTAGVFDVLMNIHTFKGMYGIWRITLVHRVHGDVTIIYVMDLAG